MGLAAGKNGRYGYGQLILVNQTLLIQTEFGRIVLVQTDPDKFTEVASLDVLHERTWNQPVVAWHTLLVRSDASWRLESSRLRTVGPVPSNSAVW